MKTPFFDYLIYALTVFLIFCLVFEASIQIPDTFTLIGRLHPLVLHFPIVLILIVIIRQWKDQNTTKDPLLFITTLATLATAITGLFLSLENDSKGSLLTKHQWIGSSLAFAMVLWYWLAGSARILKKWRYAFLSALAVLVLVTGHLGGMVTHGEGFLRLSGRPAVNDLVDANTVIFTDLIKPVLEEKCLSCHSPDKKKGKLLLTSLESMLQGGESGPALVPGNPEKSILLKRIHLPLDDEEHMPPADKIQLKTEEAVLIEQWIAEGASPDMKLSETTDNEHLSNAVAALYKADDERLETWDKLPGVSEKSIEELNNDYRTIKRLTAGSGALSIVVYPHENYGPGMLTDMKHLAKNIVELDCSGLPLSAEEMRFISRCGSLEKLDLDGTPVDDALLTPLDAMKNLRSLKLYNTGITDQSIPVFQAMNALKRLYIWNTDISPDGIESLMGSNPGILINNGIPAELQFTARLSPPMANPLKPFFRTPFWLTLEHSVEETEVYYSLTHGQPPDQFEILKDSLLIDRPMTIRFMARKEGWDDSAIDSIDFRLSAFKPDKMILRYAPDPQYPANGAGSLFDLHKGSKIFGDSLWLGFREQDFELLCLWNKPVAIGSLTLSTLVQTEPYIFPPAGIEVYAGTSQDALQPVYQQKIGIPDGPKPPQFQYFDCDLSGKPVTAVKVVVRPVSRLPEWHRAKGEKGWLFIDEVLFN